MGDIERICVTGEGEVEAVAGGSAGDRYCVLREDDAVAVVGEGAKRSWLSRR